MSINMKERLRESILKAGSLAPFDNVNKRANELSSNLSSLCKEFPETNLIIDYEKLQLFVGPAVKNYKDLLKKHVEAEKWKEKSVAAPIYSLPDEVLQNCLSFVGNGHYGLVALVSKKLHKAYVAAFTREVDMGERKIYFVRATTSYFEMAISVKLVNHCIKDLCKSPDEKVKLFKAAAVNGNVDILQAAVKDGYDLFPLVAMKKKTVYEDPDGNYHPMEYDPYDEVDSDYEEDLYDVYYVEDEGVDLSMLVERGHLHVLKYLHEELDYHEGLQRYVQPAILFGQLEILKWLHGIDCMNENDKMHKFYYDSDRASYREFAFCDEAVRCGSVQSLLWLQAHGYQITENGFAMYNAIRSSSLEMIQYLFDKGYPLNQYGISYAIRQTNSVELYRLMHNLGFEFTSITEWVRNDSSITDKFGVIKFLRSISIPWDDEIMMYIVKHGTLEMIEYAHKDGCPWTGLGHEYDVLLQNNISFSNSKGKLDVVFNCSDKWKYLIENGCMFDYGYSSIWTKKCLIEVLRNRKDHEWLKFFLGKNSDFDNQLFQYFLKHSEGDLWFGGISYILENGASFENICSWIEEVSQSQLHYETSSDWSQQRLFDLLRSKKDIELIKFFVGKKSSFDNELFQYFLDHSCGELWFEGICFLLKHGKDSQ